MTKKAICNQEVEVNHKCRIYLRREKWNVIKEISHAERD